MNLLDGALGLNSETRVSLSAGRVLLIKDCVETSGAFVLHHLLKRALSVQAAGTVLFIALAHPFSHYDRILRKQGCNLVAQRENGRFFFFDMLKLDSPGEIISEEKENKDLEIHYAHQTELGKTSVSQRKDCREGLDYGTEGLIDLYRKIQKTIDASFSPEQNRSDITIVIDDVSLLEVATHGSANCVLDFLHYCHNLSAEVDCSLIILNHDDIYSSTLAPSITVHMEYLADVVIKAEPLVTGLATDVHGQLTVLNKGIIDDHGTLRSRVYNFHFKVKENSVDCFYPGSRN